ncbi:DNA/RNA non-specific endonuclease, partial [Thauera butanivorans]
MQGNVGVDDGRAPGDHGGHLIGAQFGGYEGYENLTPMAGQINAYPKGKWGQMEKNWADRLKAGDTVQVRIELN